MTEASTVPATEGRSVDSVRVGFIGLGSQGGPMARAIAESQVRTTLWARRQETLDEFADTGAVMAQTPAELAASSDLVCICVVDDAGVESVLLGDDGVLANMAPGGAVAIHSTIHPRTCLRLAEAAAERGIGLIDAPVSGGGGAAATRSLLVMVGGDEQVLERFLPVFAIFADPVVHLGPLGSGQVTKLLNNTVFAAHLATAESVLGVGSELGIDPRKLSSVIARGSGASFAMNLVGPMGGDLAPMAATAGPLLHKDVGLLATLMAERSGTDGLVWSAADAALAKLSHPR
ncbi:NAD(P)-dependent oxidoreductase [Rhodococcus sp. BP-149]|uniref:NAD(P)-dependent oxidoreductase n=1 Tax=unclassified Rhodococcus (in: high G+C Gram-positive bacteria) TaxID=192944 RepID=UPI001C9B32EA|nr:MULTISPECIES: NAD(P)-dependent oxidoreductase [unclassified Rhodococcus (in: high G+C Gram-positive bacteria)]MBY6687778.1 NAD(P)-dependent oxidoreductase [Rhodococcus sp. BP-288]MBY6696043.1 NAD(P)-dependent oxidoreductase [Rhodococcus sp. BP-188]MBY6700640.1 NAD(P)-dependent oxidoreductase [Rhodococcus sp. BP-285]MBY6705037.1 NAD(P)-dependent oxidoreductase [Rhodococcus sp. BP-283]MBY6713765.1 NAD(P)-dependent oxidoreductase [Rhodococcus sp. BP-160]